MNSPERMPAETHKPFTGYLWGALAVLTCPCHLPILAIVLAGTTAGAFIGEHWGIAALTLTGLTIYQTICVGTRRYGFLTSSDEK
ncbi:broad-spectrum mercury transporter MerE [Salmonella enterica]